MTREQYNRGMIRSAVIGLGAACALLALLLIGCAGLMPGEYERPPQFEGQPSYIMQVTDGDPRDFAIVSKLATYESVKYSSATPDDATYIIDLLLKALDEDATYSEWFALAFDEVDWFNSQFKGEIIILQQYFSSTAPPSEIMSQYDRYMIRTHLNDVKSMLQLLKP